MEICIQHNYVVIYTHAQRHTDTDRYTHTHARTHAHTNTHTLYYIPLISMDLSKNLTGFTSRKWLRFLIPTLVDMCYTKIKQNVATFIKP